MPNYMLVSFKTCPWVQRSAIILREKNEPFEFRHIESDNRPDWFLAISPHKKVPVLRIDDKVTLFESSAINEYLDEVVSPQLHPADPIERAVNRAWTDYVPTFSSQVTGCAYAATKEAYEAAVAKIPDAFGRLEKALETQGSGPFFNGAKYSLVDAAYAPFLQRYYFLDRVKPLGVIEKYPRLKAWADALMARPSTHSFPAAEFEAMACANPCRKRLELSLVVPGKLWRAAAAGRFAFPLSRNAGEEKFYPAGASFSGGAISRSRAAVSTRSRISAFDAPR